MSEAARIRDLLQRAARRRRFDRALSGLWTGLFGGLLLWFVLVAIFKVAPLPETLVNSLWMVPLAGGVVGFLGGGWRGVPAPMAARLLEHRRGLDQRLSTACELLERQPDSEWTRLVVADAAQRASAVDVRQVLPFHLPRLGRWLPLVLLGIIGLGFIPEYRTDAWRQKQADAEAIRETGRRMSVFVREQLQRNPALSEPIREALTEAGLSADRLQQARLNRSSAVNDLASASRRMEEETRQLDTSPMLQRLAQAARSNAGNPSGGPQGSSSSGNRSGTTPPPTSPEAMEKLAEKLQQARQAVAAAAAPGASAAGVQNALSALSQLSMAAQQAGVSLENLDSAMAALQALHPERALKDLDAAGGELDRLRDLAQKMAAAKQNMDELGRTLAEQLERGQAEAAAQTLEKMSQQLAASANPEQARQILEQVSNSLRQAQSYGKAGEMLRAAAEQMKQGQSDGASKNLASAAKELRRMMEQARELDDLQQTLQAFKDAQMALMNGKEWQPGGDCKGGACRGCSAHPKSGQGGRGGRGVGTWADEDSLFLPEVTERWDNSGLQHPDRNPRGHTDRGDGLNPQNIAPTKLQGQFSPGPMPSVPIKGLSVRGQSSVPYEEAVGAAQSEARSALNEDRVPRAYRHAVKGYFDDLQ